MPKPTLSPPEYAYLNDPYGIDGKDLLIHTLQDLCLRKVIKVEERMIRLNERETRLRPRFFFMRSDNFNGYKSHKKSENFILKLLKSKSEIRFYQLRKYIKREFDNDLSIFRTRYVAKDLRKMKMVWFFILPRKSGKNACNKVTLFLNNTAALVNSNTSLSDPILQQNIAALGSNILFLEKSVLEKISSQSQELEDLNKLNFNQIIQSFEVFENLISFTSISFAGSFSSSDSFDFGGGDFGGGGAGAEW